MTIFYNHISEQYYEILSIFSSFLFIEGSFLVSLLNMQVLPVIIKHKSQELFGARYHLA